MTTARSASQEKPIHTRYQNLPLPERWYPVLEALRPADQETNAADLDLPESGEVLDLCLSLQGKHSARDTEILWQRVACERSTESVAAEYGLTPHYVLTILRIRLRSAREQGRRALRDLKARIGPAVRAVSVSGHSALYPAASTEQQWRMLNALLQGPAFHSRPLSPGRALCGQPSTLNLLAAERLLRAEPRFWAVRELAAASGCADAALRLAQNLGSPLRVTRGGRVLHANWKRAELFTALGRELRNAGVKDWHFSELAHAVNAVLPEGALNSRNAQATLASTPAGWFRQSARHGFWRLAENSEAAGPEFLGNVDMPREEIWVTALLVAQPRGTVSTRTLRRAAEEAGLDQGRLDAAIRNSKNIRLRGTAYPLYCTAAAAAERDYFSWYNNRAIRTSPISQGALQAGLDLPRTRLRLRQLQRVVQLYTQRGWDIPQNLSAAVK